MNPFHPTVAWLTWRQMFANRRFWLAVVVAFAPAIFTIVFRLVAPEGAERAGFFVLLQRGVVVGTLLPLTALVFGTTAFGGEKDDGTLVYLLVKPIDRWRIVLTKYLVTAGACAAVIIPAVALPWLLLRNGTLPFSVAKGLMMGSLVGAVLYTAPFLLLGMVLKRAFTIGLVYVIGFESVLTRSGALGARSLSIREFTISVAQSVEGAAATLGSASVPMTTVRNVGAFLLVASLAVAIWRLRRYQLEERP